MVSYSQVTFETLRDELRLNARQGGFLPPGLPPVLLPPWLSGYLAATTRALLPSPKSRAEALVVPVLHAVQDASATRVTLFSGVKLFDADPGGPCDYLFAAAPNQVAPRFPALVVIETKGLDTLASIPPCAAAMHTARQRNEAAGRPGPVYGCITTGTQWVFLKPENAQTLVDPTSFFANQLPEVLAVFQWMIDQFGFILTGVANAPAPARGATSLPPPPAPPFRAGARAPVAPPGPRGQ